MVNALAALTPGKRSGTHFTEDRVGTRALLDVSEKCSPHGVSIPGPSVAQRVRIPTELSWPTIHVIQGVTGGMDQISGGCSLC